MSARTLATSGALALLMALGHAPAAAAAPRAAPKPPARATSASRTSSSRSLAPAPAPALSPALSPAPAPAPAPAAAPAPALSPAPAPALSPAPAPDLDQSPSASPPLHHRATVTLNPLALVVGRYGANTEFVILPHHAITASGYLQTFPKALIRLALPNLDIGEGPQSRFGGELGYRLYSGKDGPTGVFVGPSFVAMPLAAPRLTEDYRAEVVSFTAYGAALDIGVQAVVGPGFTIGGGVGVMALAYSQPASAAPPPGFELPSYPEPHILPRLLVMAGWAF